MKIKDIINEVEINQYSVPNWYRKLGQTGQVIRPTMLRHTKDIGDLYVHAKPGIRTVDPTVSVSEPTIGKITEPEQQEPELPAEEPSEKATVAAKEKKPVRQNVPRLYSVRTKSGIKLTKHNDGMWRTPEGEVLDDPALVDALEKMATAQRQTAQMAPGYQPMPVSPKTQRRRRR